MPQPKKQSLTKRVKEQVEPLQLDIEQVTRTPSIFNQNQIQKIFNSTPSRHKFQRPAKGGGQWTYVKNSYVRRVLDSIFGFNWDFIIETTLQEAFDVAKLTKYCVVKGKLTGRVKMDGQWVELTKENFGRAEVKFLTEKDARGNKTLKIDEYTGSPVPMDFGNDMKAATSDCLKKCASMFGIAADVYDPEEFIPIEIIGSEENSERKKNLDKQIRNAKRTVRAAARKVGEQNEGAKHDDQAK